MEMADLWCRTWTIFSLLLLCAHFCICILKEKDSYSGTSRVLKSFFCIGVLEMAYALLQWLRLLPSMNHRFLFTGSFDNPAILAMLLSICLPIGFHFMTTEPAHKRLWVWLTACMAIFLLATGVRTGILAGVCSAIPTGWPTLKKHIGKWSKPKLFFILSFIVLAFAGLYFSKQDSADGRILIWRISMDMIAERPLWGWGLNGFDAHYMDFQANYFLRHPASKYVLLADNLTNPFNEFLLFAIRYGLAGLAALLLVLVILLKKIFMQSGMYHHVWVSICVTLCLWSLFSYPYRIPFVWLVTAYLASSALFPAMRPKKYAKPLATCILLVIILPTIRTYLSFKDKREWIQVQERASRGETEAMLPQYAMLYDRLKKDGSFLYNYGAELHFAGHYQKSLEVLKECTRQYNDYNVQMLLADDYQKLGFPQKAIEKYRYANRMVPHKFFPLYQEMQIHITEGDSLHACKTALAILQKDIKIHSRTIEKIQEEAKDCLQSYGQ